MITDVHFLRPWWLLLFIPLVGLVILVHKRTRPLLAWHHVCDAHLLPFLVKKYNKNNVSSFCLLFSMVFMIFGLAGPAWNKLAAPTYKLIIPRVLILDMSYNMMNTDLKPNRLSRAKFKLHDLLSRKQDGQYGLIVYTAEPFVVSPLTDDGKTIVSLLPMLTPDIMPVRGQKLELALNEAETLIQQAGYKYGTLLVLTANAPSAEAIDTARHLAQTGIYSSILPVKAEKNINRSFDRFAQAGHGAVVPYSPNSSDLDHWLHRISTRNTGFDMNGSNSLPQWRDEGRWFLIGALIVLLPLFQRGRLQRLVL